jgi:hypothetical protein
MANPQEIGVEEARQVPRDALPRLSEAAGSEVTGDIGDLEPQIAIQDALNRGHYDEIIVSTLPVGLSRWVKHDLVSKAQASGLPCTTSWVKTAGWPERPTPERVQQSSGTEARDMASPLPVSRSPGVSIADA